VSALFTFLQRHLLKGFVALLQILWWWGSFEETKIRGKKQENTSTKTLVPTKRKSLFRNVQAICVFAHRGIATFFFCSDVFLF